MDEKYIIEWLGMFGTDWIEGSNLEIHQRLNIWGWVDNGYIAWDAIDIYKAMKKEGLSGGMFRRNISVCQFKLNPMALHKLDYLAKKAREQDGL